MQTVSLLLRLERQRRQLHRLAELHNDLRHPEVLKASQKLDKLIIQALQPQPKQPKLP